MRDDRVPCRETLSPCRDLACYNTCAIERIRQQERTRFDTEGRAYTTRVSTWTAPPTRPPSSKRVCTRRICYGLLVLVALGVAAWML